MKRRLTGWLLALEVLAGCAAQNGPSLSNPPEDGRSPAVLDGQVQNPASPENEAPGQGERDGAPAEENTGETAQDGWEDSLSLDENGVYDGKEEVSLYLCLYDELPDNYITKKEARALGWSGGSVERVAPGYAIGGDSFGNREGYLPAAEGRQYYECDIDTLGEDSRGAKRLVYSNDGLIYYTEDHYETFELLYGEE